MSIRSVSGNDPDDEATMLLTFNDDGPGPVVVLLHGFPFDRTMWSDQRSTVGSIYRLITPDLRGFGETPSPDGIYTIEGMADDVMELLGALQLDRPLVIGGLSMGGYVALSIAVRYPDRVKGLILLNSRAASDSPEAAQNRQTLANQIEASGDPTSFLDAMVPRLFAQTTMDNHPELVQKWRSRMSKIPTRSIVSTLRGLATRPDRTDDLARISCPTLVIAGSDDQIVPLDESIRMAEAVPDGRLVIIADSGHLAPLENPDGTNAALLEFLEAVT
jgi:pimeloyl-ACP methyl ester carboxylesterase